MTTETRKPHLSTSSMTMFVRCGEQWYRRYRLHEKIPPGVAMLIGRGVDKSVDADMLHKIHTGQLLEEEIIRQTARDAVVREWESGEVALTSSERYQGAQKIKGGAVDDAVALAAHHRRALAPQIQPETVQQYWRVNLENFPFDLVGRIDIEETTNVIRDTKTSGKSPSEHEADVSLQLDLYALKRKVINGAFPKKLTLDYLIRLKNGPKSVVRETTRGEEDMPPLFHRIETVANAIEKETFLPANPTDWWCSDTFCGYASTCRYYRGHRRPTS